MNRASLIDSVATKTGAPAREVETIVLSAFEEIRAVAKAGEKVSIFNFGVFTPIARAAREVRNPQNGAKIKVGPSKVVKFSPAAAFKEELNSKRKTIAKPLNGSAKLAKASAAADVAKLPKRKPGRPSKVDTMIFDARVRQIAARIPVPGDEVAKRKPGRPSKAAVETAPEVIKRKPGRQPKVVAEAVSVSPALPETKRSPGRPRKIVPEAVVSPPAKRGPGRPKVAAEAPVVTPVKRAPGRPRKVVAEAAPIPAVTAPAKRNPGRPPKVVAEAVASPTVTKKSPGRPRKIVPEAAVSAPAKRGPGRPRKVVEVVPEAPKRRGRPAKVSA